MSTLPGFSAKSSIGTDQAGGASVSATGRLYKISKNVLVGIAHAAHKSGVDFGFLMAEAAQESNFDSKSAAKTSSAQGLFQMINQTWLGLVKNHGAGHGLASQAAAIQQDDNGQYIVKNAATRQEILDLRNNPKLAAGLGAELVRENQSALQTNLGRKVGPTELYLAHFLGSKAATQFLQQTEANRGQIAADLLPQAAAANPQVFYNQSTGKPLTLGQIYDRFQSAISDKMALFNKHRASLTQIAAGATEQSNAMQNNATNNVPSGAITAQSPANPLSGAEFARGANANLAGVKNFGAFAAAEQTRLLFGLTHKNQNSAHNAHDPMNLLRMMVEANHVAERGTHNPSMQAAQGMNLATGMGTATSFGQNSALMGLSHIALAQSAADLSPDAASLRRQGAHGGAQAAYLRPRQVTQTFKI
ncbi:MAG: hypothetical protein ORN98_03060 [Alphaproteobacteria bacterium]|nr:hypothetical protein [Alphaproteobacteria bacterium]